MFLIILGEHLPSCLTLVAGLIISSYSNRTCFTYTYIRDMFSQTFVNSPRDYFRFVEKYIVPVRV